MIVYTMVSPLVGWLGDRYHRRGLLAFGVGLWSVATVGTAFAHNFREMFFWRGLLGVGEASYGVIAPALLADLFPAKDRGRVMGLYYLALPLGGALGYGIGGWVGDRWGWPAAFWVVGVPGLLAAVGGLLIHDPGRGASDGTRTGKAERPRLGEYLELFKTPTFVLNTAGMAAVTFASGGYAAWGSTFYQTVRGMSAKQAGLWIGGLTALAGLLGISLGTWAADFMLRFTRRAYLLMASLAVLIAIPFGMLGILDPDCVSSLGMLFGAMVLLASVLGPCNAVTANVGAGQPTRRRLRDEHLPDPPARRHQLTHLDWRHRRPFRQAGRGAFVAGRGALRARGIAGPRNQPDRRHALGRPRSGTRLPLLLHRLASPAKGSGASPQAERR